MSSYLKGNFVKVVFKDDRTGESERMWVKVSSCNDQKRIVFGILDNEPIAVFLDKLWLGKEVAVSYDLIVDVLREKDAIQ